MILSLILHVAVVLQPLLQSSGGGGGSPSTQVGSQLPWPVNAFLPPNSITTNSGRGQGAACRGFKNDTVPYVTFRDIAQNKALDPIIARWEPVLTEKLAALNAALATVTPAIRAKLQAKLAEKERTQGKSAVTDADRRRWLLPKEWWQEWEVPFDTDPDWPEPLQAALDGLPGCLARQDGQGEQTIAASAAQEELVDQPRVTSGVLRVSGPFTVEGVQPAEESLDLESPIGGEPKALETFTPRRATTDEPANAEATWTR